MFAIIETLGRQYKVSVGDKIKVDRISENNQDTPEGTKITFTNVLFLGTAEGADAKIGFPLLAGASVVAKVVEQGKEKKVLAFKKKRRKGYTRKVGSRRAFTTVEIEAIQAA
ncbi:MAG: 50S ribosomal protein L21 [Deltaproteobacteria bacterium]|nr:50S ribosomal protein L21 [Deltaproteobacteria bacterium]